MVEDVGLGMHAMRPWIVKRIVKTIVKRIVKIMVKILLGRIACTP